MISSKLQDTSMTILLYFVARQKRRLWREQRQGSFPLEFSLTRNSVHNSLEKERTMKTLPITKMQQIKTTAQMVSTAVRAVALPIAGRGVVIGGYCLPVVASMF
jgi:hypothetical protein